MNTRRNFWIDDALYRAVQRAAAQEGALEGRTVSVAEFVRRALAERVRQSLVPGQSDSSSG